MDPSAVGSRKSLYEDLMGWRREGKLGGVVGERSLKTCTDNDLANADSTPVGKLVSPAKFRVLPANNSLNN